MAIYGPLTREAVVTGGVGQFSFLSGFYIKSICIIPPSGTASYKYEITDADGFGRVKTYQVLTGNSVLDGRICCIGTNTLRIYDATEDGTYRVRLYCETL